MKAVSGVDELLQKWEADAATMEQYSDARGAAVCRLHVAELKEAVRTEQDESLTLTEAALESGYSESHLRHKVADGALPNAGRTGAPRIRRGDLPAKTNGRRLVDPSPEVAAANILRRFPPSP